MVKAKQISEYVIEHLRTCQALPDDDAPEDIRNEGNVNAIIAWHRVNGQPDDVFKKEGNGSFHRLNDRA